MLAIRVKIVVLHLLWAGVCVAQIDTLPDESDSTDPQVSQAEQAAAEKAKAEKSKADNEDKIFIPSEEISEDQPVPFPVDI